MFSDRSMPGVGSALLTFLETSAKQMGYRELKLETRHINRRAVDFYEKMDMFVLIIMAHTLAEKRQSVSQRHCADCIYRTELMWQARSRQAG